MKLSTCAVSLMRRHTLFLLRWIPVDKAINIVSINDVLFYLPEPYLLLIRKLILFTRLSLMQFNCNTSEYTVYALFMLPHFS